MTGCSWSCHSIGIPGVELRAVNDHGEPIKPGETGLVLACGDNIMMGNFADDEGTKNAIRNGWLKPEAWALLIRMVTLT